MFHFNCIFFPPLLVRPFYLQRWLAAPRSHLLHFNVLSSFQFHSFSTHSPWFVYVQACSSQTQLACQPLYLIMLTVFIVQKKKQNACERDQSLTEIVQNCKISDCKSNPFKRRGFSQPWPHWPRHLLGSDLQQTTSKETLMKRQSDNSSWTNS